MPYRSEKIKIAGTLKDRRVKLSTEQRVEIVRLWKDGKSIHSLAKDFNVSRRTIQLEVHPERKELMHEYRKENWKKYVNRENLTKAVRDLRHYKQELFLKGEISLQS